MSFSASSGRILVTDTDGTVSFDTDDRALVWTDFKEGSFYVGQRSTTAATLFADSIRRYSYVDASGTLISNQVGELNLDTDRTIAAINPSATVVMGAFKLTPDAGADGSRGQQGSLVQGGWFQATGSCMTHISFDDNDSRAANTYRWVTGITFYSFRASSGSLIFNERTLLRGCVAIGTTGFTYTIVGTTVEYKLYCGAFV